MGRTGYLGSEEIALLQNEEDWAPAVTSGRAETPRAKQLAETLESLLGSLQSKYLGQ